MTPLKAGFGLLLLATAWWMARPLLADGVYVAGWVLLALWAALLAWSAAAQGAGEAGPMRLLARALALMLALWGLAQGAGLLAGGQDMLRPLAPFTAGAGGAAASADPAAIRARFTRVASWADLDARLAAADRPVMLDFYADWCVSCLEMEKFTFSDPAVAERMGRMLLLQAGCDPHDGRGPRLAGAFRPVRPAGDPVFDARGQDHSRGPGGGVQEGGGLSQGAGPSAGRSLKKAAARDQPGSVGGLVRAAEFAG